MTGRRRGRPVLRFLVGLVVAAVALSACSGVPSSSLPQVVRTVDGTGVAVATPTVRPETGDEPQTIVMKFLQAQVTNDQSHQAAKAFLTPAASTKWQDDTVTVVNDFRVQFPDANNNVQIRGQVIGTLANTGVYTPTLTQTTVQNDRPFASFALVQVDGQWRISDPPNGLIVRQSDFASAFHRRLLYFFDQSETQLVPDMRYSPLDGQSLSTWLLTQLIDGPTQQSSGLRNEFPDQIDPQRSKVTLADPIAVQLPGLSQTDPNTVTRIAAEIAYAFQAAGQNDPITMLDGTKAVPIASGDSTFTATDFPSFDPVPAAVPKLFFLRDGVLTDEAGAAVGGKGSNQEPLETVAVADVSATDMRISGLTARRGNLYVGTQSAGLQAVRLSRPATSRPEWVSATGYEVWLGEGSALVRVVGGRLSQIPFTALNTDLSGKTVSAVRVSPEGDRVAMVLTDTVTGNSLGDGAVWIGNVVRTGQSLQVSGLHQITPGGWNVRDVSWSTSGVALRAIGSDAASEIEIWSFMVDGSSVTEPSSDNLPTLPDWVTSTTDGSTWVSVDRTVWREASLGGWVNPFAPATQVGTAPIYSVP